MKRIAHNFAAVIALCALVSACSRDGRTMQSPSPDQTQSIAIVTTVAEAVGSTTGFSITTPWADGGAIDAIFTCTGGGVSPSGTGAGLSRSASLRRRFSSFTTSRSDFRCSSVSLVMSMMELIFLRFSPTPAAIRLISTLLKSPIRVPTAPDTAPKISAICLFARRWSSGSESMMA